jgi:hypothetical protein
MDSQTHVTGRKSRSFRPLHSFSLRTLFVVVTLCAVTCPAIPTLIAKYRRWRGPKIVYTLIKPVYDPPLGDSSAVQDDWPE